MTCSHVYGNWISLTTCPDVFDGTLNTQMDKQIHKPGDNMTKPNIQTFRSPVRWIALVLSVGGALFASQSIAQSGEPGRPQASSYRFVVGFGAGGVPDAAARLVAAKFAERQKVSAIVDGKLGAGGTLAAQNVLASPADGSVILSVSPAHATAPAVFKKLPYDTLHDFRPVTLLGEGPAVLVVPNDLKVRNVAELIAYAKSNPGKLNYSSAGVGSSSHFAADLFKTHADIDVVHIPYKGVSEALTEVLTGRVQFHVTPYTTAAALVKEGKVRALAVTTRARIADWPDVPTVAESGLPGYEWTFWYGFLVPAKTPKPAVDFLNKEFNAIVRLPDVQRQLNQMGVVVSAGSSDEFAKLIEMEVAKFQKIAKSSGIQPQ